MSTNCSEKSFARLAPRLRSPPAAWRILHCARHSQIIFPAGRETCWSTVYKLSLCTRVLAICNSRLALNNRIPKFQRKDILRNAKIDNLIDLRYRLRGCMPWTRTSISQSYRTLNTRHRGGFPDGSYGASRAKFKVFGTLLTSPCSAPFFWVSWRNTGWCCSSHRLTVEQIQQYSRDAYHKPWTCRVDPWMIR